jgi:hypothetical protein
MPRNDQASAVDEFVESLLSPDAAQLRDIASRMRFIEEDPMIQWSILELQGS